MTNLSRVSQTLLDYSRSGAKRNWSPVVGPEHLFAAIRRLDEKWFDETFPDVKEKLNALLSAKKGQALSPKSVDASVTGYLETISDKSDLPDIAKQIYASLRESLDNPVDIKEEELDSEVQIRQDESASGDDEEEETRLLTPAGPQLALNIALVKRIAEHLKSDESSIAQDMASDGRLLAQRVLGTDTDAVKSALKESLGTAGELKSESVSNLIPQLLATPGSESDRLATRLGLAQVDLAEFAASLDQVVTEHEIQTINDFRLEVRAALGDRIDATSDAVLEFEEQFAELVGMESVKEDLRKRVEYMIVNRRKESRGQHAPTHRMHMAFVGNPGTGKTTVARLFGQMLNKLGLLGSDVFVETDRAGLVGEYVGHTEKKTRDAIRKATGGVLFVDEAYALNDRYGERKGFGEEAVDVIVKEMEDRRDKLAVILAGYSDRMDDFLSINPGLKSRVPSVISFPDYSTNELLEIGRRIARSRGLQLDESAEMALGAALEVKRKEDGFGNAREVQNTMDAAQRNLLERLSHLGNLATDRESSLILGEDIPKPSQERKENIGFGRYI